MNIVNRRPLLSAVAAGLCLLAPDRAAAEEISVIELAMPRVAAAGETVQLIIRAGRLPKGARLTVTSEEGNILGALTPFGQELGGGSSAAIPVPRSRILNGRLRLRLAVVAPDEAPRAPRAGEIKSLKLLVLPAP